jgi:hypothetical protein
MKKLIIQGTAVLTVTGGLTLGSGCDCYRNLVDPCYPERYEYATRVETESAMAPQVYNGHVLDQTVWNYDFEPGTDKLTIAGIEHLAYLARRRPCPDSYVYLQTAHDLVYDQAKPERFVQARTDLDRRRAQVVLGYLNADTAGRHLTFDVVVHDPAEVGLAATPAGISIRKEELGFQGVLPTAAGAGASNVSGGGGVGGGAQGTGR